MGPTDRTAAAVASVTASETVSGIRGRSRPQAEGSATRIRHRFRRSRRIRHRNSSQFPLRKATAHPSGWAVSTDQLLCSGTSGPPSLPAHSPLLTALHAERLSATAGCLHLWNLEFEARAFQRFHVIHDA